MKVGILTFHRAINYGAVLQAYALQTKIKSKNVECQIIDYQCEAFSNEYKVFRIYNKSLKGIISAIIQLPFRYIKFSKFKLFVNRRMHLSDLSYSRNTISSTNDYYDTFIVGSDQVWNYNLSGFDKTYFLDFVINNIKKNSYAASFGISSIPVFKEDSYRELLKDYNCISVRENSGQDILLSLLGKSVECVLDPVFLLKSQQWESVLVKPNIGEKYILVYSLNDDDIFHYADQLSKKTGLKIVCIQNGFKKPIKANYIRTAGVEQFVGWIKYADYVITDSFHGISFSIIFHKNFWAQLNRGKNDKNSRITSLLGYLKLDDRILNKDNSLDLMKNINYSLSDTLLDSALKASEQFIDNIIN